MIIKDSFIKRDYFFVLGILILLVFSIVVLQSIAPSLFPYYFFYLFMALLVFFIFSQISFNVISLFSWHFYIGSIIFLTLPIIIGQITRGTIRWINLGPLTIQPSEIVRPFLFVFFANYLTQREITLKRFICAVGLLLIPVLLILIQPSLGVSVLTLMGFIGILLASGLNKRYFILGMVSILILIPLFWQILAPYQKQRILSFIKPGQDPFGQGYNSLQSMIAVGSGKLLGRGLGRGVQTQLAFLPERHTDFIFASVSEEMGFVGSVTIILLLFFVFFKLASFINVSQDKAARAYISGLFLTLFIQTTVHIGMNIGLLPITGVPLPLLSAGGSSLLGTMLGLGIALGSIKRE